MMRIEYRAPLRLALGLSLTAVLACAPTTEPDPGGPVSGAAAPRAGASEWTTADGIRVPYVVGGRLDAETSVVFVHCWMCDGSFWDAQLPAVAGRFRTVTLDLPGHGAATGEREAWTVGGLGGDVAGLVRELGLQHVILVGHSMGGQVSLRAAALLPGIARGIIAVDTLHDAEFRFDGERVGAIIDAFETDFVGTCNRFVEQMFVEEGVGQVVEHVRRTSCVETRGAVGAALMRDFNAIDLPRWFREAGVPIRAINAGAPYDTRIEANRRYADYDAATMDDVGHYLHMTRPARFNELMLQAIEDLLGVGRPDSHAPQSHG